MPSYSGCLLVARPSLRDGFFNRSVILLLQHGPDGALGVILNRPAPAKDVPFPVYLGGPCKMDGLLMIHAHKDWGEDDPPAEVCPGVYLGNAACFEKVSGEFQDPAWQFRVFVGYSGWGPKQLEAELNQDAWIVVPARADLIFPHPADELWEHLAPPTTPAPSLN